MKRQSTEWENIFANGVNNKGLIANIYKQLRKLNTEKTKKLNPKVGRSPNRHLSKKDIQMTSRHIKWCSTLPIIREMQIKATMRYFLSLVRIAILKMSTHNKCWTGYVEKGTILHCWWECKLVQPLCKMAWTFPQKIKVWLTMCMIQQTCLWVYMWEKQED